ncbi:MAG: rhodanese-like domain-containing protein [Bacteroidetes bacterium]|nr:rhodanese-like domain-containing protein [Bacteroidota bacterium]
MYKKIYTHVLILILLLNVNACAQQTDENNITVKQLNENIKTDSTLIILDVRMPQELRGELGQIEGVINIPVQELEKRIHELEKYKNNNINIICRSGRRSAIASEFLNKNGFKTKNVLGGMIEYRKNEK